MPRPLELDPAVTAVVTMELQRAVVGDLALHAELVAAAAPILPVVGQLCRAAREAGATVLHATMGYRPGGEGFTTNGPIQRASVRANAALLESGAPGAELVPELDARAGDLVSERHTGMTPVTGTDLDAQLRGRGVDTVVATGVSVNLGVLGLVLSLADLGYRVVVPRDAVAGLPATYAAAVLEGTIALVATLSTASAVRDALVNM